MNKQEDRPLEEIVNNIKHNGLNSDLAKELRDWDFVVKGANSKDEEERTKIQRDRWIDAIKKVTKEADSIDKSKGWWGARNFFNEWCKNRGIDIN